MNDSLEIKLKEEKVPTMWERFLHWFNGNADHSKLRVQQLPKTGTNTDILLSQTQKMDLKEAVESPLRERTSDTTSFTRKDVGQDSSLII